MEVQVNTFGILTGIPINSWMPFLHMINYLRLGFPYDKIRCEVVAGYGNIKDETLRRWRRIYQISLGRGLTALGARTVGGRGEYVVIDESVVGVQCQDEWSVENSGDQQKRRASAA